MDQMEIMFELTFVYIYQRDYAKIMSNDCTYTFPTLDSVWKLFNKLKTEDKKSLISITSSMCGS